MDWTWKIELLLCIASEHNGMGNLMWWRIHHLFSPVVVLNNHPIHGGHKDCLLLTTGCIHLEHQNHEEYRVCALQHIFAYPSRQFLHHKGGREVYLFHYAFVERKDSLEYLWLVVTHLHLCHNMAKWLGCWCYGYRIFLIFSFPLFAR